MEQLRCMITMTWSLTTTVYRTEDWKEWPERNRKNRKSSTKFNTMTSSRIEKAVDSGMKDRTTSTAYAMKLSSAQNTLLDRVNHIISNSNTHNTMSMDNIEAVSSIV